MTVRNGGQVKWLCCDGHEEPDGDENALGEDWLCEVCPWCEVDRVGGCGACSDLKENE